MPQFCRATSVHDGAPQRACSLIPCTAAACAPMATVGFSPVSKYHLTGRIGQADFRLPRYYPVLSFQYPERVVPDSASHMPAVPSGHWCCLVGINGKPLASQLLFTRRGRFHASGTQSYLVYSEPATITIFIPLNWLSTGWLHSEFIAQTSFRETPVSVIACARLVKFIIIHGSCISVRRFYIRTALMATSVQYAILRRIYTFPHWAVDFINQNKMRVNNQFPVPPHDRCGLYTGCPAKLLAE